MGVVVVAVVVDFGWRGCGRFGDDGGGGGDG